MGLPKNHAKSRKFNAKVKTEPGKPQTHHHHKNLAFVPQSKFAETCRAKTGQTFSRNRADKFKATLNNISIYIRAKYGHEVGITLKAQKEVVILQQNYPKLKTAESTMYI